ncbi:hypothetical protein BHM03_00025111 [Ensete ventricosum]|nr:hypothetical protein BHM03_00025111 [Ensete ventricosum]
MGKDMRTGFVKCLTLSKRKCLKYDERCERGAIPERFHDTREKRCEINVYDDAPGSAVRRDLLCGTRRSAG